MSEMHGGHAHGIEGDKFGTMVGVVVAIIGILLAGITIESHRAHTAAIVYKTEANDDWAYLQAKKIRGHISDVGIQLINALSNDASRNAALVDKMKEDIKHYSEDADELKKEADEKDKESKHAEAQAVKFDLGEGLLELGMVLSSLYFLSKRKLFPALGFCAAAAGIVIGGYGFFLV